MKITADTLAAISERVAPFDTEQNRERYREGRFPRADVVRDLDMRYRWDLFHAGRCYDLVKHDDTITSNHIDTALRRIVQPLGK